jgi:hypothetical protein
MKGCQNDETATCDVPPIPENHPPHNDDRYTSWRQSSPSRARMRCKKQEAEHVPPPTPARPPTLVPVVNQMSCQLSIQISLLSTSNDHTASHQQWPTHRLPISLSRSLKPLIFLSMKLGTKERMQVWYWSKKGIFDISISCLNGAST